MFLISDKMIPFDNKSYILPFISKMLSEGLSSPLYKQVREEKHLVYAINSEAAYYKLLGQNFLVNTSASIDKVNDIKNEILYVLNNPEKFLTQKYFNEIKENTRIRKIIREQNKTSINSVSINFLEDKRISFQDKLDIINYDEVMNYYDMYVHPKNVNYEFLTHRQINS
jgi:predicted Zn-dependent peptidase